MKLSNEKYAGKSLVTSFGTITFDANGDANVPDEAVEALTQLPGFTSDKTDYADNGDSRTTSGDEETTGSGDQGNTQGDTGDTQDDGENGKDGDEGDDEDSGAEKDTENTGDKSTELNEADLKKLQVPSLKKLCKDKGLDITGITTKQPLIDLLLGKK